MVTGKKMPMRRGKTPGLAWQRGREFDGRRQGNGNRRGHSLKKCKRKINREVHETGLTGARSTIKVDPTTDQTGGGER